MTLHYSSHHIFMELLVNCDEHFRATILCQDHRSSHDVKILHRNNADVGGVRQELADVDWESGVASEGMARKYVFKSGLTRVQGQHVPVRLKNKAGKFCKPWLFRDVEILVREKEAYVRFRQSGSSKSFPGYK